MEYEIKDDPQGDDDWNDADRTGGVREDHILRHRHGRAGRPRREHRQAA